VRAVGSKRGQEHWRFTNPSGAGVRLARRSFGEGGSTPVVTKSNWSEKRQPQLGADKKKTTFTLLKKAQKIDTFANRGQNILTSDLSVNSHGETGDGGSPH